MEQPEQICPEIKNENILGLIKYVGHRKDFLEFAQNLASKVYDIRIPIDPEKHPQHELFRNNATMFIFGTVNGVERNEIVFAKNTPIIVKNEGQPKNVDPVS
jgi:hypothetical protein